MSDVRALARSSYATLVAGMLITGSLGSLHAFSVFVTPLEAQLGVSRAEVSSIYSLALCFLTLTVLLGHRIYSCLSPPTLAAFACVTAAVGLFLAAHAQSLTLLYAGYSMLFGAANGVGYGFMLQLVAQAMPERRGFAMGIVTAVYALGATLFAKILALRIQTAGPGEAMTDVAFVLLLVAVSVAVLLRWSGAEYQGEKQVSSTTQPGDRRLLALLWGGYGCGAAAGLMAIGHATGIVAAAGGLGGQLVLGAMLIGLGNAAGGAVAGSLADRWPVKRLLIALPLLSVGVLLVLMGLTRPLLAVGALCLIGFAYGAIIAVYPAAAAHHFGTRRAARAYGRIFTAWGLAGLAAPWLAGKIYDIQGDYSLSLMLAAAAGLLSAIAAALLPKPTPTN